MSLTLFSEREKIGIQVGEMFDVQHQHKKVPFTQTKESIIVGIKQRPKILKITLVFAQYLRLYIFFPKLTNKHNTIFSKKS